MERKRRTVSRLKEYKASLLLFIVLGLISVIGFCTVTVFDNSIKEIMFENTEPVFNDMYHGSMKDASRTVNIAFSYIERSILFSFLVSITGIIMIYSFLRFGKATLYNHITLFMFGVGGYFLTLFYFLVSITLPELAQVKKTIGAYNVIKTLGLILMLISYIMYVTKLFKVIFFEKQ